MKINDAQSQLDASQLIEQMQKAHNEGQEARATGGGFALQGAAAPEAPREVSALERSVMQVAQRVLDGEVTEPVAARREVIGVIVDERYGELVEPSQRRRAMQALEVTLGQDPTFAREVDNMLILAARDLATR